MSHLIWAPGSPRDEFFLDPLKFVPTVDQPHQGESVHVNGHEVTTKDISDAVSKKLNDLVSQRSQKLRYVVTWHEATIH